MVAALNWRDVLDSWSGLPEEWEPVHSRRVEKYKSDIKVKGVDAVETCYSCPAARVFYNTVHATLPNGILITFEDMFVGCIFLDKCIKEYPHMKDAKEFK